MNAYKTALLIVHVLSAIVGIGATFTFGVLGSLQSRIEGPGPKRWSRRMRPSRNALSGPSRSFSFRCPAR